MLYVVLVSPDFDIPPRPIFVTPYRALAMNYCEKQCGVTPIPAWDYLFGADDTGNETEHSIPVVTMKAGNAIYIIYKVKADLGQPVA